MPVRALPWEGAAMAAYQRRLSPLQVALLRPRSGGGGGAALRVDADAGDALALWK